MPTRGNPRHGFRFKPGEWEAFTEAVERDPLGRTMADVARDLLVGWYARTKSGEPVRPPRKSPTRRD